MSGSSGAAETLSPSKNTWPQALALPRGGHARTCCCRAEVLGHLYVILPIPETAKMNHFNPLEIPSYPRFCFLENVDILKVCL